MQAPTVSQAKAYTRAHFAAYDNPPRYIEGSTRVDHYDVGTVSQFFAVMYADGFIEHGEMVVWLEADDSGNTVVYGEW